MKVKYWEDCRSLEEITDDVKDMISSGEVNEIISLTHSSIINAAYGLIKYSAILVYKKNK